jgi:hypothetical protein
VVSSVPVVVSEPTAVNRCRWNGGVIVNADPPPVPGVIVNDAEEV